MAQYQTGQPTVGAFEFQVEQLESGARGEDRGNLRADVVWPADGLAETGYRGWPWPRPMTMNFCTGLGGRCETLTLKPIKPRRTCDRKRD